MLDNIIENTKVFDWKSQSIGEGENSIPIPIIISRIERGYYKTKEVDLDITIYNLRNDVFQCTNLFEFLTHYKLVENSNLDYPVIINQEGQIVDGRHRLCKAILQGKKTIKGIMIMDCSIL